MSYFARKLAGRFHNPPLRVRPGDVIISKTHNLYLIVSEHWIRTGQFGAGYMEYVVHWLNAPPERRATGTVAEHTMNARDHYNIGV